jgi:hypothetical protein
MGTDLIRRHWRGFHAWMKQSVLAAIFVRWFARWTSASPWCVWITDYRLKHGKSARVALTVRRHHSNFEILLDSFVETWKTAKGK